MPCPALPFSLKRPAGCRPSTTTDQVHLPQIIMMRARSFPIRCNMYLRSNHPSHYSAGCRVSNAYNGVYPRTARPLLYSVLPSTTNCSPTIAEETDVCNGGPLDTCDDDQDVTCCWSAAAVHLCFPNTSEKAGHSRGAVQQLSLSLILPRTDLKLPS